MTTIVNVLVGLLIWGIAALGVALLVNPKKVVPVISKFGLAGVYYDRERGSLLPMWAWRLMGAGYLAMGSFSGVLFVVSRIG